MDMGKRNDSILRAVSIGLPVLLVAVGAAIYASMPVQAYYEYANWLGISAQERPLGDTWAVITAIDCARRGIDVIGPNACMDFDYSPLWLSLAAFPFSARQALGIGLAVDAAFLLSLLCLPGVRGQSAGAIMIAATVSSSVLFGLERANMDLALFALLAVATWMLVRSGALRCIGYSLIVLGGLLKYYPMAALVWALRERPFRLGLVAAATIFATIAFVVLSWHDLTRAVGNVPVGYPLGNMFGSVTIARAIVEEAHLSESLVPVIHLPMVALGLFFGVSFGLKPCTTRALASLDEARRAFLVIGALVILFCFFASQSIAYRGVFLLFTLPALLALRGFSDNRFFKGAPLWVLIVLWHQLWRNRLLWIAHQLFGKTARDGVQYLVCLVREWFWWSLVVVLIGYVVAFAASSVTGQAILQQFKVRRPLPTAG